MANHFDGPPALVGDEARQLEQMYRYLQTMSDKLNEALFSISTENFTVETRSQIEAAGSTAVDEKIRKSQTTVRSLIVKSAEIVRHEMEEISTRLEDRYLAISDQFGTLEREMTATIEANAAGIRQNYDYIEDMQSRVEGVEGYTRHNSEYIFSGLIGLDSSGNPIYGIAIGEGITQYDSDGNAVINDNAKVATFTKERLSFWQGNTEMAYFSDQMLYVNEMRVLNGMRMGNYVWKIQTDGSMGLMVAQTT